MPSKAFGRFEAGEPDQLWVSDGLHGPIIEGKRAVLFALLDDHSRYVVGHRWGHGEDTLGMQAVLHDAVKTHGCPARLYCDIHTEFAGARPSPRDCDRSSRCADFLPVECVGGRVPHLGSCAC